jgi:hypothetical protein
MVLTYPSGHELQVDFGNKRVHYKYSVAAQDATMLRDQQIWCDKMFKTDTVWYRFNNKEFAFVHKKDAMWFALKWS